MKPRQSSAPKRAIRGASALASTYIVNKFCLSEEENNFQRKIPKIRTKSEQIARPFYLECTHEDSDGEIRLSRSPSESEIILMDLLKCESSPPEKATVIVPRGKHDGRNPKLKYINIKELKLEPERKNSFSAKKTDKATILDRDMMSILMNKLGKKNLVMKRKIDFVKNSFSLNETQKRSNYPFNSIGKYFPELPDQGKVKENGPRLLSRKQNIFLASSFSFLASEYPSKKLKSGKEPIKPIFQNPTHISMNNTTIGFKVLNESRNQLKKNTAVAKKNMPEKGSQKISPTIKIPSDKGEKKIQIDSRDSNNYDEIKGWAVEKETNGFSISSDIEL